MGAFAIGERNERGDRLIEFVEEHTNTLYQKAKNKCWTLESPDGEARNHTDFAISNQRGIATNCEVITKAD